jgi:SAM-dependent methyltransferase
VCAFEVLEHIDDDRAALAQWVGRLAPGGTLLLSTPAGPRRMGPHDVIAGHFRRYSADGLGELARGVGLVDVRVVHVGFPVGYALEAVRNAAASRRLAGQGGPGLPTDDVAGRTEASSSIMQPPAWSGPLMRAASAPFRGGQRTAPTRGTGLVLIARAR